MACTFFFEPETVSQEPGQRHAPPLDLHACALCAKPLARNSDIFMYMGDTPFCSDDCRYEQINHDAALARQQASSRRKQQQQAQAQAQRSAREAPAPAPVSAAAVSAKANVSVAS
ncbi:FCS-Like Zinc finger 3-like [Lolium rigidum]|uniref:FCS-Like Zinc finger 3-like n=1 Tax=Lolium rigidum TaxID=89674 RepID=UPI001F5D934A|nr:FCS-Like Zinc finger 3-like [Lolium rigidum]